MDGVQNGAVLRGFCASGRSAETADIGNFSLQSPFVSFHPKLIGNVTVKKSARFPRIFLSQLAETLRPDRAKQVVTTRAYPSYHLVAANNRTITDLDKLYDLLMSLPAEDEVSLILKATTSADQFYRQYHLVTLPRGKPRWLKASQTADD